MKPYIVFFLAKIVVNCNNLIIFQNYNDLKIISFNFLCARNLYSPVYLSVTMKVF